MKYILDNCKDLFLTHYYLIYFCATFSSLYLLLTLQTMLWFPDNLLKVNPDKYHLLFSTNGERYLNVGMDDVNAIEFSDSKCKRLLELKLIAN